MAPNHPKLTRAQRDALRRVWHRDDQGLSFKRFLETVQPTYHMDGAVAVQWCNMWLAIEVDGYCHS